MNHNLLIHQFKINNEFFLIDFKKRLKKSISKGRFIAPFTGYLDKNDNLNLLYFNNMKKRHEIYRYELDGNFKDLLVMPEEISGIFCISNKEKILAEIKDQSIGIFE